MQTLNEKHTAKKLLSLFQKLKVNFDFGQFRISYIMYSLHPKYATDKCNIWQVHSKHHVSLVGWEQSQAKGSLPTRMAAWWWEILPKVQVKYFIQFKLWQDSCLHYYVLSSGVLWNVTHQMCLVAEQCISAGNNLKPILYITSFQWA